MQEIGVNDSLTFVLTGDDGTRQEVEVPYKLLDWMTRTLSAPSSAVLMLESTHDLETPQWLHPWFAAFPKARFPQALVQIAEVFEHELPGCTAVAMPALRELCVPDEPLREAVLPQRPSLFEGE